MWWWCSLNAVCLIFGRFYSNLLYIFTNNKRNAQCSPGRVQLDEWTSSKFNSNLQLGHNYQRQVRNTITNDEHIYTTSKQYSEFHIHSLTIYSTTMACIFAINYRQSWLYSPMETGIELRQHPRMHLSHLHWNWLNYRVHCLACSNITTYICIYLLSPRQYDRNFV